VRAEPIELNVEQDTLPAEIWNYGTLGYRTTVVNTMVEFEGVVILK